MRNVLLVLWGLILAAGAGFLAGRATAHRPEPAPAEIAKLPSNSGGPKPVPEPETRARAAEPGPLEQRSLLVPVVGIKRENIQDTFYQKRDSDRVHEASDIMAERGTPVIAVDDGVIKKIFESKPGGHTIYQFDETERYCYYYAHLDRYAEGITEGSQIHKGQVIGYVGTTGNADPNAPHLHFAIFELGPEKQWWKGTPINPYPLLMRAAVR